MENCSLSQMPITKGTLTVNTSQVETHYKRSIESLKFLKQLCVDTEEQKKAVVGRSSCLLKQRRE